nr:MAG TPA: hypothetical protein [Herelleviridae sp.]
MRACVVSHLCYLIYLSNLNFQYSVYIGSCE